MVDNKLREINVNDPPNLEVVVTSHVALIQTRTSQAMLRCPPDVATGTSMRRIYLTRLCEAH